jgi:hypothetical protein
MEDSWDLTDIFYFLIYVNSFLKTVNSNVFKRRMTLFNRVLISVGLWETSVLLFAFPKLFIFYPTHSFPFQTHFLSPAFLILLAFGLQFRALLLIWTSYSDCKKKLRGFESASELDRSSDRRRSAKLVHTLADKGCHVASATSPSDRNFDFLDLDSDCRFT